MKKFFLMAAFAAFAMGASAQNFALTCNVAEGDLVNGQTIDVDITAEIEYENGIKLSEVYEYNPHFTARSLTGDAININVTVNSSIPYQICFPANCVNGEAGQSTTVSGPISTEGSDLRFDIGCGMVLYDNGEEFWNDFENPGAGTGTITVSDGTTSITVNVNWTGKLKGTDSVEGIGAEDAAKEYYNLQGMRVERPESGLYIVRQGRKVTKVLAK